MKGDPLDIAKNLGGMMLQSADFYAPDAVGAVAKAKEQVVLNQLRQV